MKINNMEDIREGVLVGFGNPLLDISANVEGKFLEKYGLQPDNAILADETHAPLYKELVSKYHVDYIAGGSVQNSLRVAQWFLKKPNITVFFGCVGEDDFSKILEEKARSAGVNVKYQYTKEAPTGTCAVLLTGTHRSLCANLGAANCFKYNNINYDDFINQAEYFYISGFFLTVSPRTIMDVAKQCFQLNKILIMNLSAPFISTLYKKPLMDAMPYIDILFGNEMEAETFSDKQGWKTKDLKEIGSKIVELPKYKQERPRIVIITQGHKPVLLIENDKITEFPVERLDPSKVVDTNGAGDAFVGGFLAQYIQKKSLDVCIRCGIYAARHIIQQSGCTYDGEACFCE